MDVLHFFNVDPLVAAVALLGTMVFALVGVVAWLYWQQSKLFTNMNSVVAAFAEVMQQSQAQVPHAEPEAPPPPPPTEDDRASVDEEEEESGPAPEVVDGPPGPLDTDTIESKTKKELQEILTKRGIPFGKGDSKTVLLSLLKATA